MIARSDFGLPDQENLAPAAMALDKRVIPSLLK
jgi:hypothetical protein